MLLSVVFFGLLASEAFAAEHLNITIVTPTLPCYADGVNVTSLSQVLNLIGHTGLQRKEVVTTAIGAIVERFLQTFLGIPVYSTFVEISDMGNGMQNVTGSIYDGMDGDLEDQLNCTMDEGLAVAIALDHAKLNSTTPTTNIKLHRFIIILDNGTAASAIQLFVTVTLPNGNQTELLSYISECDGQVIDQYDLGEPFGPTEFPIDSWTGPTAFPMVWTTTTDGGKAPPSTNKSSISSNWRRGKKRETDE